MLRDGRLSCLLVPVPTLLLTVRGRFASARSYKIFSYSISIPLSSSWPVRSALGNKISIVIYVILPHLSLVLIDLLTVPSVMVIW